MTTVSPFVLGMNPRYCVSPKLTRFGQDTPLPVAEDPEAATDRFEGVGEPSSPGVHPKHQPAVSRRDQRGNAGGVTRNEDPAVAAARRERSEQRRKKAEAEKLVLDALRVAGSNPNAILKAEKVLQDAERQGIAIHHLDRGIEFLTAWQQAARVRVAQLLKEMRRNSVNLGQVQELSYYLHRQVHVEDPMAAGKALADLALKKQGSHPGIALQAVDCIETLGDEVVHALARQSTAYYDLLADLLIPADRDD